MVVAVHGDHRRLAAVLDERRLEFSQRDAETGGEPAVVPIDGHDVVVPREDPGPRKKQWITHLLAVTGCRLAHPGVVVER